MCSRQYTRKMRETITDAKCQQIGGDSAGYETFHDNNVIGGFEIINVGDNISSRHSCRRHGFVFVRVVFSLLLLLSVIAAAGLMIVTGLLNSTEYEHDQVHDNVLYATLVMLLVSLIGNLKGMMQCCKTVKECCRLCNIVTSG
eukprot:775875_1